MNKNKNPYVDYYYDKLKDYGKEEDVYERAANELNKAQRSAVKKIDVWMVQIKQLESEDAGNTEEEEIMPSIIRSHKPPKKPKPKTQKDLGYSYYKK